MEYIAAAYIELIIIINWTYYFIFIFANIFKIAAGVPADQYLYHALPD